MAGLIEIRCQNELSSGKCNAFLCKASGDVEIVCRRCGCKNIYNSQTGKVTAYPVRSKLGDRKTSSGMVFR